MSFLGTITIQVSNVLLVGTPILLVLFFVMKHKTDKLKEEIERTRDLATIKLLLIGFKRGQDTVQNYYVNFELTGGGLFKPIGSTYHLKKPEDVVMMGTEVWRRIGNSDDVAIGEKVLTFAG